MNQDTITVGIPISLTGQFSSQGVQALQGVTYWVEDTNARGGLHLDEHGKNLPVRLVHYDDESTPGATRLVTRKLITEDYVDLLFGPYSSSLTLACASVTENLGMVLWNHGGSSDEVQRRGFSRVVSILAPASSYLRGVVDFLMDKSPHMRTVAILRSARGSFPEAVAGGFERYATENGWQVVYEEAYQPSEVDFKAAVARIQAAKPDVVIGVGRIQDDLELGREIVSANMKAEAMALVASGVSLFGTEMGSSAEGFIGPSQWESGAAYTPDHGPAVEELRLRHKGFRDGGADYTMAQGYAVGLIAEHCLMEAGATDGRRLMEAAYRLNCTTFYEPFKIHRRVGAQVGRQVCLVRWVDGRKVVVWPPELISR